MRALASWSFALCLAAAILTPGLAHADDVADEADLKFQLGADAYQRGDYKTALQHFLGSNRLVANKNVLFNIAKTYEKLGRYPEAHRYLSLALAAETEPVARARIQTELDQLARRVLVLEIRTTPPGATLYIDRKNLGPRGESPRQLGLAPGSYKIIAEKPGYRPAEVIVGPGRVGEVKRVELELVAILGSVRIEGPARGAAVHLDEEAAPVACTVPCRLRVTPGRHVLYLTRAGHRTSAVPVSVRPNTELTVRPELAPITGSLVANTDEPGALIEVDGRPVGFTPAIVPVPIGLHRVRLSLEGFRSVEREVVIAEGRQTRLEATLLGFEEVIAASRQREAVEDAPSSVTIIPAQELSALAYPTIAEAVRGVRGLYVWDDRSYASVGFRGLGRQGSYGNRVLVLLDGHPLNDNWIGSSYVGYDARTDLADVQRIEVVRGPGSVLYGTNAFSGVINLVTRDKSVPPGMQVGISTNLDAVGRARVRGDARFSGGGVWTSVAGAKSTGRDFFFPEYLGEPSPEPGHSRDADGFEAGTISGRVWWQWLTAQWFVHSHDKQIPTGQYETTLGDSRTNQIDTRASLEARAEPRLGKVVTLLSRAHLNHYRFDGRYARAPVDGGIEHDQFRGSWVGFEQRVVVSASESVRLTLGGEGQLHFQVDQSARDDAGFFLEETGERGRPFEVGAAYAMADARLSEALALSGGARLDSYSTFGSSLNPRAAVIVRPYARGNTKLMAGKAFRAPSVYELYYNDGGATQVASPDLEPESIYSAELEHTHRFSTTVSATGAVFANYVTDLIVARGTGVGTDPIRYENSGVPLASVGGELELRRDWRQGWMLAGSYGYARPLYLSSNDLGALLRLESDPDSRRVSNAPAHLAALKAAVPVLSRALTAATRVSFESPRYDRFEQSEDEPQQRTDWIVVWDVVFSGLEPRWGLRYALGVYNAFDWRYSLPVSQEFRQRAIPQGGRSLLLSADLAF
jgi:outer membrane receptor for ferrienterochelin and colicin